MKLDEIETSGLTMKLNHWLEDVEVTIYYIDLVECQKGYIVNLGTLLASRLGRTKRGIIEINLNNVGLISGRHGGW